MQDSYSALSLNITTADYMFGGVVLLIVLFLGWKSYGRNPRPLTILLESLRLIIVCLVLFLLAKPEWTTNYISRAEPELVILWDDSGSMETQDVEQGNTLLISRAEEVKNLLDSRFWTIWEDKNKVSVIPFSSPEKNEEGESSALSGTDISAALEEILEGKTNLRSVVLLSDGDYNLGQSPAGVAQKYRKRNIPVFTIPIGSEISLPDVAMESVRPPAYGIVGESVQIPFTVRNTLGKEVNTSVTLRSGNGRSVNKDVRLPAYGTLSDNILWTIDQEGIDNLEIFVPVQAGERSDRNNKLGFTLSGRQESIRILILENEPRWEYRFIRNALYRDPGVEVRTLLFHPAMNEMGGGEGYLTRFPEKLEDLSRFDVIFIGDVGMGADGLSMEQCDLIRGLVETQASGLVFLPGPKGNQASLVDSPLGDLMPVVLENRDKTGYRDIVASPLLLSPAGRSSLLTTLANTDDENARVWRNLPGFYWYAPVERAKAGALVLATHPVRRNRYGRIPLLVTRMAGAGKVLYMGTDSAWRWRRGVEDKYHYRFWGQVARWMSYQRNMAAGERVRLYPDQERPKLGDQVLLTASVSDVNGAPLKEGPVYADVIAPDGKTAGRIELKAEGTTWGVFTGYVKIDRPGEWKINVRAPGDDDDVTLSLYSATDSIEKTGRVARPDVLSEISHITRGRMVKAEEIDSLVNDIILLPEPLPMERRYLIWCHWLSGLVVLLLMSIFWMGRKLNGTV